MTEPALDPQIADAMRRLPPAASDLEGARRNHAQATALLCGPGEAVARVEDLSVPGGAGDVPVRLYVPDARAAQLPLVVYAHGGGWIMGTLDTYDPLCRALANRAEAAVLSVGYRLAPEDTFPAAVKDCWAALQWAAEHAGDVGADVRRLAVAGDSAGGNLAAVLALRARDHGGPALRFQLLVYPAVDPRRATGSYGTYRDGPGLTAAEMEWCWSTYLDGGDPASTDAAPARAALAGLPPALVILAEHDPLRDEGLAYAAALRAAGVDAQELVVPGTVHGFWRWLGAADASRETLDHAGAALRAALAP